MLKMSHNFGQYFIKMISTKMLYQIKALLYYFNQKLKFSIILKKYVQKILKIKLKWKKRVKKFPKFKNWSKKL